jgi:hypothetical protein
MSKKTSTKKSYVYLAAEVDKKGNHIHYKIGCSTQVEKRVNGKITSDNGNDIILLKKKEGDRELERYLIYTRYKKYRIHGEWFLPDKFIFADFDSVIKPDDAKVLIENYENALDESGRRQKVEKITKISKREIKKVMKNCGGYTLKLEGGARHFIDIKKAVKNNVPLLTPSYNRVHGPDQQRTGKSISLYGSQGPLMVITPIMADAAGIEYRHFDGTKCSASDKKTGLVIVDGNGRVDYLLKVPFEYWPKTLIASFPVEDCLGYYDIAKIIQEVNVNTKPWHTADYNLMRAIERGPHPMFDSIQEARAKGYPYSTACIIYTLRDNIKKSTILGTKDNDELAENYKYALIVHEEMVKKFGEGKDGVIKSIKISKLIRDQWNKFVASSDADTATKRICEFIRSISKDVVERMREATPTTTKEGLRVTRDEVREKEFSVAFDMFIHK